MDPDLKEKGGGRDGNHKNRLQRQRLDQLLNRLKGLEPHNMLTKTPELRVRSVEGTTWPVRKKNSPAL
ncbi:hypothetical protein TSUD_197670 [Trifolium subterraneum]|uniref:Uncharacterized protein n=1 Tax=Trifolium subterraneum TaxID=3900 RepID=A0A2Z6LGB8_TRISU|nr:hypothetical protein TSUD_197670 [Trifolium subterraneum]